MALLVLLGACSKDPGEEVRTRLYGVWRTASPQYAGAALEISPSRIRFLTVRGTVDENDILYMEEGHCHDGVMVRITYADIHGTESLLDLCLTTMPGEDIISFINQDHIVWKKSAQPLEMDDI